MGVVSGRRRGQEMDRRLRFKIIGAIFVSVFVCGVVVPPLLLAWSPPIDYSSSSRDGFLLGSMKTARRALADYSRGQLSRDELSLQVSEMERIKLSIRNELRFLQNERLRVLQETEKHKKSLEQVQQGVEAAKKELLLAKSGLARVSHELYLSRPNSAHSTVPPAPPIVILPPRPHHPPHTAGAAAAAADHSRRQCSFTECFNLAMCPLMKPFKIFIYSPSNHYPLYSYMSNQSLMEDFKQILRETNSLAFTFHEACVFVVLLQSWVESSKLETLLHSLPYWNMDGSNHVIINLSLLTDVSLLNTGHAVIVQQSFPKPSTYQTQYDIVLPPLPHSAHGSWKGFPSQVPAYRNHLVYFHGKRKAGEGGIEIEQLDQLAVELGKNEPVHIVTDCDDEMSRREGDWSLCGSASVRSDSLTEATFSIIPSGGISSSATAYQRLSEALYHGAVPVLVGIYPLPFQAVIDWSRAALVIPIGRFHELHLLIRSLSTDKLLEMRRQGRFLWQTYFSSPTNILKTVSTIVRASVLHSPPAAPEFKGQLLHKIPGGTVKLQSPSYTNNYSYYSHAVWNNPPGPFLMYPYSPWSSNPVSGSQFAAMDTKQLKELPPHIVLATGITGPYFESYLLGNSPEEHFTVVMLTYKRNDVLMESLERLNGLNFLAKVVVIWNNPEDIPDTIQWPTISAPIEVVRASHNSLNNRFLPLDNVQTEAILSIDDDVYLRHDEIQFAFRVWRESRDRLVGFPGRFHAYDVRHRNWLYNANHTCELSMVLTGAAFFHKYYSFMYTHWMTHEIHQMVDQYMNCEDIAMNFLISHLTRKPPLKVTSRWTFRCPGCPDTLSQSDQHFTERHHCINQLTAMYGYMPLLYTQFRLDSVLFKTRLPSHLEKCYQYV